MKIKPSYSGRKVSSYPRCYACPNPQLDFIFAFKVTVLFDCNFSLAQKVMSLLECYVDL